MVAREYVGWMPGRNKNFPGEDADQLREISVCPESAVAGQAAQPGGQALGAAAPRPRLRCVCEPGS